jgi:hypothetical protein
MGNLHLTVDGLQIQPVNHTKLLGLTLDSELNWTVHLNEKERQVRKIFFSLGNGKNLGHLRHPPESDVLSSRASFIVPLSGRQKSELSKAGKN